MLGCIFKILVHFDCMEAKNMTDAEDPQAEADVVNPENSQDTPQTPTKRSRKKLWGCLIVLCLFLILCIGILVTLPFIFKDKIVAMALSSVEAQYGRKITVGSVHVVPSLSPTFSMRKLVVAEREGFGNQPTLAAEGIEIKIGLLPLLEREIRVDKLVLENPRIRIVRDETGQWNFQDLISETNEAPAPASSDAAQPTAPNQAASPSQADEPAVSGFSIRKAVITSGFVDFEDRLEQRHPRIEDFNLTLKLRSLDDPVALEMDMKLSADNTAALVGLKGKIQALNEGKFSMAHVAIEGLEMRVKDLDCAYYAPYLAPFLPFVLDGGVLDAEVDLDVDKGVKKVQVRLDSRLADGAVHKKIMIPPPENAPEGTPALERELVLAEKEITVKFAGTVEHLMEEFGQFVTIKQCEIRTDSGLLALTASGNAREFTSENLSGDLKVQMDADIPYLASLVAQVRELPMRDPAGRMHFSGAVSGNLKQMLANGTLGLNQLGFVLLPKEGGKAEAFAFNKLDAEFDVTVRDFLAPAIQVDFPKLILKTELGTFHLAGAATEVLADVTYQITKADVRVPDLAKTAEFARRFAPALPQISGSFLASGAITQGSLVNVDGIEAVLTLNDLSLLLPAFGEAPFKQKHLQLKVSASVNDLLEETLEVHRMRASLDSELFTNLEISGKAQPLHPAMPFNIQMKGGLVIEETARTFQTLIPPQFTDLRGVLQMDLKATNTTDGMRAKGKLDLSSVTGGFADLVNKKASPETPDEVSLVIRKLTGLDQGFDPARMDAVLEVILNRFVFKQKAKTQAPDPELTHLSAKIKTKQGKAQIEGVSADLFNGKLTADLVADFSKTENFTNMSALSYTKGNLTLEDVNMNAVSRVFTTYGDVFYGTLLFHMKEMKGRGTGLEDLRKHLGAHGDMILKDGKLDNLDKQPVTGSIIKLLKTIPDMPDLRTYPFKVSKGAYEIKKGKVHLKHVAFYGNDMFEVILDGTVALDDQFTCDLGVRIKPLEGSGIHIDSVTKWLDEDRYIPLRVTGPAARPKPNFDWDRIAKAIAKRAEKELKEKLRKEEKKQKKKIEDKLKKTIKGLF